MEKDLKNKIKLICATTIIFFIISLVIDNEYHLAAIITALIESIIFAIILFYGETYLVKNLINKINFSLLADENITFEAPASIFKGNSMNTIGGKLVLTNKRLLFKSHLLNFSSAQFSIDTKDIENITPEKYSKLVDNGLKISTSDKKTIKLIVTKRDQLYNLLSPISNK